MTKKIKEINTRNNSDLSFIKLSIQISLNGLSFCVLDSISNTIIKQESTTFSEELIPFQVLKKLKEVLENNEIDKMSFSNVTIIHRNTFFSLIPKALFDEKEVANYLKFNTKILANDLIAWDEILNFDIINVYVPFVNINNYIYGLYGEFVFQHNGTVLIQSLLNNFDGGKEPVCYVHVLEQQLDIIVIANKKLLFYNSFNFNTKEDFIYYVLFVIEQLKLDVETIKLKLFGNIEEDDQLFNVCFKYVRNVSVFVPSNLSYLMDINHHKSIDFTTLSAL
jgi:hypothetical protein